MNTFPNPPIMEAIFDIQVRLSDDVDIEVMENIQSGLEKRFPTKEPQYAIHAELKVPSKDDFEGGTTQIPTKTDALGFMFKSENDKKIFQARLNGFSFNKLRPYEDWEHFFAEAKDLWSIYREKANPIEINRIALRYINKIFIPLPIETFEDYVLSAPQLPEGLPQGMAGFLTQYSIPNPDIGAMALVTQTIEMPTSDNKLPYIFDVDVFKKGGFDDKDPSFWDNFNEMRDYKNKIFKNCLTDKAKELFK